MVGEEALQRLRNATLVESSIIIYLWKIPLKSHCSRAASRQRIERPPATPQVSGDAPNSLDRTLFADVQPLALRRRCVG
jgi:hypothetical protein